MACAIITLDAHAQSTIIRINTGGSAYTDIAGNVWSADTGYTGGTAQSVSGTVSNTSDPTLYLTEREISTGTLPYGFSVPNGTYQVKLHFAELWLTWANGRKFNVQLEGATVFTNIDVYAEAGYRKALIKTATVSVPDGQLNIGIVRVSGDPAFVSAIEIIGQTTDTQAPTAPSSLTATVISSSQINLSWTGSTDNVAVAGYRVERCTGASCTTFAEIASPTTTSYSNTGLSGATAYTYRVRAVDAAGNLSAYSSAASALTQGGAGVIGYIQSASAESSTAQTVLSATYPAVQTAGNLNIVVVGWSGAAEILSLTDTVGNTYQLAAGPTSQAAAGTQHIYYAANIGSAAANNNQVTVTFNAAVTNLDLRIAEYKGADLYNPVDAGSEGTGSSNLADSGAATTSCANTLLVGANYAVAAATGAGAGYTQRLISTRGSMIEDRLVSAAGNYNATAPLASSGGWVMHLVAFRAADVCGDTQPPTTPTGLTTLVASSTQINLSWTGSTDNVAVTGYRIERCQGASCSNFTQIATTTGTTYNNTGLTTSTNYSYRVRAHDAAPNLSAYSNTASATTQAGDTQAPTAPATLTAAAASSSQVNLSWAASTDNVAVTGYFIERCEGTGCSNFTQVATSTTTGYNSTGLIASTSYSYRVRATDAANNLSAYSNTASAATQGTGDTQAPTAPASLTASVASASQINLSWAAATDNVGVTNYLIERCQGTGCSNFTQVATSTTTSHNNTGLGASTNYSYRVRASDAASNLSLYSNTASATTQGGGGTGTTIRVNTGGSAYTDTAGNVWSADTGYTGGTAQSVSGTVSNTSDPTLYVTEREISGTLPYSFPFQMARIR